MTYGAPFTPPVNDDETKIVSNLCSQKSVKGTLGKAICEAAIKSYFKNR